MYINTKLKRVKWLLGLLFANPYEPPTTPCQAIEDVDGDGFFVTSIRFDWLTVAALAARLLSSAAVYLYHTAGTSMIGDPILRHLALASVIWIPVYRMAMPLLILVMPRCCRRAYAVFFLVLGILCSLNDFLGHFFGIYLINFVFDNSSVGLCAGLALCLVLSLGQFAFDTVYAANRNRCIGYALSWLGILLSIQAIFFALSLVI